MNSRTDSGGLSVSGEVLLDGIRRLPSPERYWVGFSGGADSTTLLQALYEVRDRLPAPLHAVYFNHGLLEEASDWQEHCRTFCENRNIPFRAEKLEIRRAERASLEEEARNSRYRAVAGMLGEREMYLTAHHAEDQAETLFLNLMRGSGVEGLAGIPRLRSLGAGWVARPLLDVHREELEAFLESRGIGWIEDPSNADTSFDRNYLRQELFPLLEHRWPGLSRCLSRTARNARATSTALARFIENQSGDLLGDPIRMPVTRLLELDTNLQALVLRQWLRRHEVPMLPESRLREFLQQLSDSKPDGQPEVGWQDWMIRRYRHDLWLHRRAPISPCAETTWQSGMRIELGPDAGEYVLVGEKTGLPTGWRIGSRKGGDRIRPMIEGPSRKLKHCFQSASIPPWLRLGIPVLYWDDEPVALGDWMIGHRLNQWLVDNGLELEWKPADPVLTRVRRDCQD